MAGKGTSADLFNAAPALYEALAGIGALPEGYCFCFNKSRDATRPDVEHTGECRAARAALSAARGDA